MKALAIARIALVRLIRDRSNLFFVFILPLLIVMLIGVAFGGGFDPVLGVAVDGDGPAAERLVAALEDLDDLETVPFDSRESVLSAVARGRVDAGMVVPAGYEAALASGGTAQVEYIAGPNTTGQALQTTVAAAIAAESNVLRAARFAASEADVPLEEAQRIAGAIEVPGVEVDVRRAGEAVYEGSEELGQFGLGASQELLLFVFLTSLAGSAALIQTRQLGIARRMLSTPTSSRTILLGQALGRFVVAMVQGLYIVVGTGLIFGVDWGDWTATLAVVTVFSMVSAGAAMLAGSLASNDQTAGGVGVFLGLGFGALGGCMVPLEIFSPTMRQVAHLTPHAWGNDAFAILLRRGGGVVDVLPELGVLASYAVVLLAVASWRLHRVTVR